jgi:hypothetical protein
VSSADDLVAAAQLMAAKRIRHLRVCEGRVPNRDDRNPQRAAGLAEQREGARDTARALLSRAPRA